MLVQSSQERILMIHIGSQILLVQWIQKIRHDPLFMEGEG